MRTIPIALQAHLDSDATSTCHLLRIAPVRAGYSVVGLTDLDVDVAYNDGDGAVSYLAPVGFTSSALVTTSDFSVDNAETQSLFPEYEVPQVSEADIRAGAYDYAAFKLYLVNHADLTQGHVLLMTGTLGEMKTVDGVAFFGELRSLFQQFRQSIVERDSLTCRATFGSQAADSPDAATAPKIERFPCGVVVDGLWQEGAVTQLGVEGTRVFRDASLISGVNAFAPGIVEWLSGANTGRQQEVEANTEGGLITLAFPTAFDIAEGDTFRIRPDCTKAWGGDRSCYSYNNRLNFRGEPFIPVGDAGATSIPGAASGSGVVQTTTPSEGGSVNPYEPPAGTVALALQNPWFEEGNVGWLLLNTPLTSDPDSPAFGQSTGLPSGYSFAIINSPGNGYLTSDWFARYISVGGSTQWTTLAQAVVANNNPSGGAGIRARCWIRLNVKPASGNSYFGLYVEAFRDAALTDRAGVSMAYRYIFSGTPDSEIGAWRSNEINVEGKFYFRISLLARADSACEVDFDHLTWNATQAAP